MFYFKKSQSCYSNIATWLLPVFFFCYLILVSNTDHKGCNLSGTMGSDGTMIAETSVGGGSF